MSTIQKRQKREKELVMESLRKVPIIGVACAKSGISRATFYRWKAHDTAFAQLADDAQLEGEALINELAVSKIIKAINEDNLTGAMYWLNHRDPKFSNKVEISAAQKSDEILSKEQEEVVKKALLLTGIIRKDDEK